jgi:PadR family transcriptional regulator, regulatory protein PadR
VSMDKQLQLLHGMLDLLILKAVSLGPLHGYGILLRIQQISRDRLEIQQGSLYTTLYRLEHQGWVTSEWGGGQTIEEQSITASPRQESADYKMKPKNGTAWSDVIEGILGTTPEEV